MADDSNQTGAGYSNYLVPALLAVMALAGGLSWSLTPLSSMRPAVNSRRPSDIERAQNIEARLWQDPLAAVDEALREARGSNGADTTVAGADFQPLDSTGLKDVLAADVLDTPPDADRVNGLHVLLAMLPASTYSEDAESRLRMREALVSALSTAGYRAQDEERIGAWKLAWPRTVAHIEDQAPLEVPPLAVNGVPTSDALFAFERFRMRRNIDRIPQSPDRALVIWLPDSLFDGAPLERLTQLVREVRTLPGAKDGPLQIDILGPVGSSMLRDMLPWEGGKQPAPPDPPAAAPGKPLAGVRMFSWSATAMDDLLVHGWQSNHPRSKVKRYLERRWGLTFINTTATDDQLSAELVQELALRGVDLAHGDEHVALLYEWDTFYGRTLPISFAAEVRRRQANPGAGAGQLRELKAAVADALQHSEKAGLVSSLVPNVHAFTYLRGVDGKTRRDEADEKSAEPTPEPTSTTAKEQRKTNREEMNRAEGENQLDYIPRIALALQQMRDDLHAGTDGKTGKLKAIGLMGSDFYDKLLILQALRPHFPDVVFFTTDLDGRFVDPEVKKWTRNLVVASSFGLTLDRPWQGTAPPFRGSYQTSLYLAALEALDVVKAAAQQRAPPPRRYEIGRVNAVDLSVSRDKFGLQAPLARRVDFRAIWESVLLVATGAWLLVIFVPPLRNTFRPLEREFARQSAILFTCKDIFLPDEVTAGKLESDYPGLEKFPLPIDRGEVAARLNTIVRAGHDSGVDPADPARLKCLVGRPVCPFPALAWLLPWWGREGVRKLKKETERLATRRLALEKRLLWAVGSCQARCRVLNEKLDGAPLGVLTIASVAVVFVLLLSCSHLRRNGEPFSVFEGVSTWPCEIFRLVAIVLTAVFVFRGHLDLRMNERCLAEEFFLSRRRRASCWQTGKRWSRHCHRHYPRLAYAFAWLTYVCSLPRRYSAIGWESLPAPVTAQRLWNQYRDRSRSLPRMARSGAHVVLFFVFCFLLLLLTRDDLFVPARGKLARGLDTCLLVCAIIFFAYLNFLVADAVRLARTFIRQLIQGETIWPKLILEEECEKMGARDAADVTEWLDIQFVGQLTKSVGRLVFYPAIVLGLLIVARTRYFDNWGWPWALVMIFTLNACWLLVSAFLMQAAAKEAREDALAKIEAKIIAAKAAIDEKQAKALKDILKQVNDYREGAFTSYLDNPALKALLVPFTGAGIMNMVNILTSN